MCRWVCGWVHVHGYGWVVGVCVRCEYECMWHVCVCGVCDCMGLGGEKRG